MSDVVIELPVSFGEEAAAFGAYLSRFMRSRESEAECAANSDAPYLMMRSDPLRDHEVKVLIFQHTSIAQAFARGWSLVRDGLGRTAAAA